MKKLLAKLFARKPERSGREHKWITPDPAIDPRPIGPEIEKVCKLIRCGDFRHEHLYSSISRWRFALVEELECELQNCCKKVNWPECDVGTKDYCPYDTKCSYELRLGSNRRTLNANEHHAVLKAFDAYYERCNAASKRRMLVAVEKFHSYTPIDRVAISEGNG